MRLRIFVSSIFLCLVAAGQSRAEAPAPPPAETAVLADASGSLTIADMSGPASDRFTAANGATPAYGITSTVYWARFRMPAAPAILEIDYRGIDDVRLYLPHETGFTEHLSGDRLPFSARSVRHRLEAFEIPAGAGWAYLRLASSGPLVFPLRLWTPEAFRAHDQEERLLLGIYYGAMIVLVLYNLLLFVAFRNAHYFSFALFTAAFAAAQFIENGLAFELIWPRSPWLENVSFPVAVGLAVFWAVGFAMGFLHAREAPKRLYHAGLLLLAVTAVAAAVAPFIPYRFALQAVSSVWVLAIVYALALTGVAAKRHSRAALFFVVAWGALIMGSLMTVLANFGLVPHGFYTYYGPQLGALILVAVLSAGMADRISALRRRRDQAVRDSNLDGLTGIANRRRFDEYLAVEWQRAMREHRELALVFIDLDYFHQYNERYGHVQGDACLQSIAGALARVIKRPADLVARYGGEEFAVVLPNTGLAGARHVADDMRAAIESLGLAHPSSEARPVVTASLGVAAEVPAPGREPAALILAADEALYYAKRNGRNRVAEAAERPAGVPA